MADSYILGTVIISRLNMDVAAIGPLALNAKTPVRIAGRCTVFAESDMIHKQPMGHRVDDILYGLCQAMARNYLNNVGLGKEIGEKIAFLGGVAFNQGMIRRLKTCCRRRFTCRPITR